MTTEFAPVLFLDVDGVLNTRPGSLDRDKLNLVWDIIRQTQCLICLSSSWRTSSRMLDRISNELPIWQYTPEIKGYESLDWSPGQHRSHEIRLFLNTHRNINKLAILDDYDEGWGSLTKAVVVCDPQKGLGPDEAAFVKTKLNMPNLVTQYQVADYE